MPRGLLEGRFLRDNALGVEPGLHGENGTLGRFEHRVQPPNHRHRQNDVAVLAAHIEIAQHIVGNAPNKVGNAIELVVLHGSSLGGCYR